MLRGLFHHIIKHPQNVRCGVTADRAGAIQRCGQMAVRPQHETGGLQIAFACLVEHSGLSRELGAVYAVSQRICDGLTLLRLSSFLQRVDGDR